MAEFNLRLVDPSGQPLPGEDLKVQGEWAQRFLTTDEQGRASTTIGPSDTGFLVDLPGREKDFRTQSGVDRTVTIDRLSDPTARPEGGGGMATDTRTTGGGSVGGVGAGALAVIAIIGFILLQVFD